MQDKYKKLLMGLGMAVIGGTQTLFFDKVIKAHFPERLILRDLLFEITPHIPSFSYLADGIIACSFVLTLLFFTKRNVERIAQFAFAFGVMTFFRSLLNLLTPIGDPSGDTEIYGFLERQPLVGMFPSGHIAALNIQYWLVREWKLGKRWEYFFVFLIILETFSLLVTRGHYSIDIAGGIALGYIAVKFTKQFLK
ncbi:phosphatase PAP2 family protein [bacterium]|nr:phosphatase PAP2 family protein [bacterium]